MVTRSLTQAAKQQKETNCTIVVTLRLTSLPKSGHRNSIKLGMGNVPNVQVR